MNPSIECINQNENGRGQNGIECGQDSDVDPILQSDDDKFIYGPSYRNSFINN